MSIQAVAWALEQDLPARPKLVLVSIANHADHRTGYCYLRADTIAEEASCSVRGVHNFIGDLVRNGFIRREHKRAVDGKQRANDYWILFSRAADVKWVGDRAGASDDAEPEETSISCEPDARRALGEIEAEAPPEPAENAHRALGPDAPACTRKSLDEPSKTNPEKSAAPNPFAAAPRSYKAPPIAPDIQGATHVQTATRLFVIKGTRGWDAWMAYRKRTKGMDTNPTYRKQVTINGVLCWRDGWDFPTLFPPGQRAESESSEEGSGSDPPLKNTA